MNVSPFTLAVALRYLRTLRRNKSIKYARLLTLACLLITLSIFALDNYWVSKHPSMDSLHRVLVFGKYLSVLTTSLVLLFVELISKFTIFTTISTFGMFLGTGALVTVISFMSAIQTDLKQKMLGIHAHMTIEPEGRPYLTEYRQLLPKAAQVQGVLSATPYLSAEMVITNAASQHLASGVLVQGIEPTTFIQVTDLEKKMLSGSLRLLERPQGAPSNQTTTNNPSQLRMPGMVIGQELAKNLGRTRPLSIGSEVLLMSPFGEGPMGNIPSIRRFQIVGVFYTGMYDYDARYAYITLPKMQKVLGLDDEVGGIELKLQDENLSEQWITPVSKVIQEGGNSVYRVEDWKTKNKNLFASLRLEKIIMFLGLCLIILVAASSIISNGLMLVSEKQKEISILKSMGATDRDILKIFTFLGLIVGCFGVGLGVIAGITACALLSTFGLPISDDVYYITRVDIRVNPIEVSMISASAMIIVLLATLHPAKMAATTRPLDGLR